MTIFRNAIGLACLLFFVVSCGTSPPSGEKNKREANSALGPYQYVPGRYLSVSDYEILEKSFDASRLRGRGTDRASHRLNQALDRELSAALYDLYTRPDVRVTYGAFNDPHGPDRKDRRIVVDGASGFRVIRQLEIPFGEDTRLISSILFLDFDPTSEDLAFSSQEDAFRVRAEVVEFDPSLNGNSKGFLGLSYSVHTSQARKVTQFWPTNPLNDAGEVKDERVTTCSLANHCNLCHHREHRNLVDDQLERPLNELQGFSDFLDYVGRRMPNGSPKTLTSLRERLAAPGQTLAPPGFIDLIRQKWDRVRAGRDT